MSFRNTPTSKAILIATSCATIAGLAQPSIGTTLQLSLGAIRSLKLWKLFTAPVAFKNLAELFFGVLALNHFKFFERQMGSRKFTMFAFVTTSLCTGLELAYMNWVDPTHISAGGYGLIFASFVRYFFTTPHTLEFPMFGLHLSSKAFMYLAGVQLMLHSPMRSLVSATSGVIAGLLYHSNFLYIASLQMPEFMATASNATVRRLLDSADGDEGHVRRFWAEREEANRPETHGQGYTDQLIGGDFRANPAVRRRAPRPQPAVVANEEHVAVLTQLGFDREQVIQALRRTNNDLGAASNLLVDAASEQ